ncbi:putative steryl acetyl hydrolase mug81 [Ophidiomyces ophidiicola]|nr:putative steryl acetyl hydrolase mug81 [Ophidiomyces ophidiicola]KAI1987910.1 putative steryl acetyl hydrolase mug81 [Ophidiomyces ophidiicola]KAI1994662.1 putative steryl acetyl hydrolase mug81 [Ophidiomyces ophidiicola]KAI1996337.1 putative steryl acetyl hydrolase mug81 [Ophidiomyces ophidiicola]
MASPSEPQWLAELDAMKKAVEMLQSPNEANSQFHYGADLNLTDEDFSSPPPDDIWDIIDGHYDSADDLDDIHGVALLEESAATSTTYDQDWLESRCTLIAQQKEGLSASELQQQLNDILAGTSSNDELQMILAEIVGFDQLDFVIDLIAHRKTVLSSLTKAGNTIMSKLRTKAQRDHALIRQDYEHKNAPLAARQDREGPQYPHVYKSYNAGNTISVNGRKYGLPIGSTHREEPRYTEYAIPATKVGVLGGDRKLVPISSMDGLCRGTFKGYQTLNRMQSLLYNVAYKTNENMLICAPTGAGKTDAAMLTILNAIAKYALPNPAEEPDCHQFLVQTDELKIVYVAPMKALAAEVTEKLGKRLAWLGIEVRELTGDMQLTKQEIVQTQIIVTTPEKWDVVTRKSTGDTELVRKVRLLIIDEVHMLHDERGAVIESLVARTQRQVESTQSLIRIIGLSATLPNYLDVADFLKVNRMAGLFFFDASFRPVPLEQHFIGVKGDPGSKRSRENLDIVTFEKVREMLELGHQVMVFVHSRKDTANTAKLLTQMAADEQCSDLFSPHDHENYSQAIRDLKTSRGREIRDLVPKGLGIHHAGMARSDRNLMERFFSEGVIKVLCCTATLAWGVNLPAAAVVIKGTQLYSAQEGKFIDLGILDVLQIFGRAGRPQFQDTGIGFICTTHNKLQHYISAVTSQEPIESRFSRKLVDNLNAEISLGTVTSVTEAVQWLGYSYLFVRMTRNPHAYGIDWAEIRDDPQLIQRRRDLIMKAARVLQQSQMIIFNERTEELRSKDVGRIASQYYVLQTSVEIFNTMMTPNGSDADVMKMISMSGEFDNIQSRETEFKELDRLRLEGLRTEVEGSNDSPHAKTNILLQSHISRARVEDFALVSDTAYVAQNAARICRSLFMIALNRRWGYQCQVLLSTCKSIEKQIWPFQHPFYQFDLPRPILKNLDEKFPASSIESMRDMESAELGQLVHNNRMGHVLSKLLDNFPTVNVEAEIAPLNRDVLRIRLLLYPEFEWNFRHHGTSEPYWVWVENSETSEIYHHEYFILNRKKLHDHHELNFTIPLSDPLPSQIYVRVISDRWLGAETVTPVSFQHLIRPDTVTTYTDLLDLQPLPISALKNPALEEIYGQRFQFFNPMQTQIFHTLYHTSANVLLGSPTGSGKTVAAELAMWWAFRDKPGSKVVYIAPMKALVRERVQDWRRRLAIPLGLKLVELTGDNTPDTRTIRNADIIITTPEKWDGISRSWQTRGYVRQVSLVIIDEIHLLGGDRGPILEIIVSRMNYIASQSKGLVRLLGMSTACANAADLGGWLGVNHGLYNFRHSVRPVPLEIYIDGFPEQRGFSPFMQSMNRPTFLAIKNHSPDKPVIIFVASRRQTRLTAKDLINFCGMEDDPRRFVHMSEDDLHINLARVKDDILKEALSFGIGLHHAGLVESDRQLAEELFANNKIQLLVATSTLAWGVNLPAHLVVVKGTQFFDAKIEGYRDMDLTDVLQMLGRAGRPQFDSSGIARIFTQNSKKAFYKHFLHTGFPVESTLHKVLDDHIGAEISAGTIATKQDALDYLTWTFFFRRLYKNPSYYGLDIPPEEHNTIAAQQMAADFMIKLVDKSLSELAASSCILFDETSGFVDPTPYGKIMSYYYISHKTVRFWMSRVSTNPTFADVLGWMCSATEFDELPVRHNEELINAELATNLPLPISAVGTDMPLWDPHIKAFLLLQAFMSRIDLPISDYVGDQISVLDQGVRVIQACIDVLAELGYAKSCWMLMTLLQSIKAARWPDDHPLSILPGANSELQELKDKNNTKIPNSLQDVILLPPSKLADLTEALHLESSTAKDFTAAVSLLPNIKVTVAEFTDTGLVVQLDRRPAASRPQNPLPQHSGGIPIYAPRFPKSQTEGLFVTITSSEYPGANEELLALKRVSWENKYQNRDRGNNVSPTVRTNIKLFSDKKSGGSNNAEHLKGKMKVKVVSDAYPGLEWELQC